MSFFIPFLLLLPSEDAGTPRDKGQAVHLPEVRGVIATQVRFSDTARQKVAAEEARDHFEGVRAGLRQGFLNRQNEALARVGTVQFRGCSAESQGGAVTQGQSPGAGERDTIDCAARAGRSEGTIP